MHGADGFGDTGYLPASRLPEEEHAAAAIVRLARERPGELTLVALAPLTNLALALRLDPSLPQRVARLVVMGGAVNGRGNTERVPAEFNIGFDPEAAHVVFSAWPQFDLVDWEACLRHTFDFARFDAWLAEGDARARFYAAISRKARAFNRARGRPGVVAADALAMAVALDPDIVDARRSASRRDRNVGRLTRGATVVDWEERLGRPANARIVLDVDQARFEALAARSLGAAAHPDPRRARPETRDRAGRLARHQGRRLSCRSFPARRRSIRMKTDTHPKYQPVVFQDLSSDFSFLTRSTMSSKETIKWEDGKEYPLIKVEISSHSHPFFTGKQKTMDAGGRVDKFRRRYAK